jgi:hypothetical protein
LTKTAKPEVCLSIKLESSGFVHHCPLYHLNVFTTQLTLYIRNMPSSTSYFPTCLILGGAGFIGSHVAKRLKKDGHRVIVVDLHYPRYFKETEICDLFVLSDLRGSNSLSPAIMLGVDWVFLFAADMGGIFLSFKY